MQSLALTTTLAFLGTPAIAEETPRIQAPDAPWKTLRTAHYAIHFPARGDFQPFAQEVASKIEGIHAQVIEWVGFETPRLIHVLIRDPQLEANGMALPFLDRPSVELWKTHPEADSPIGHFTSWVDLLVTHELTHVHHLLRPQNKPAWTDRVLDLPVGPLARKAPRWVSEGYATVIEGKITGSGRPHSAYRASVLRQWALQGKLPDYGSVSGFGGFRGGAMAYLVGSAYLEWLERQNPTQPDILKTFWKQLASKKRRDFEPSFRATFGMPPRDGYDRWRAEVTHDALELEKRAKQRRLLREGEVWARFEGEVTDLAVSPDGAHLLARILTKDFRGLKVWKLGGEATSPGTQKVDEKPDPNEVEDRPAEGPERKPEWILGRVGGSVPEKPEWGPAHPTSPGHGIQFSVRRPNEEGSLQRQGFRWTPSQHRPPQPLLSPGLADSSQGIPAPNLPLPKHLIGSLRSQGGPTSRKTYGALAEAGTWNLFEFDAERRRQLTCTLSAAWNPAPTPDGKSLYYTQLTATGVEIRKLDLTLPPLEDQAIAWDAEPLAPDTVVSRTDEPSRLPPPVLTPEATDYRLADSLWNRGRSGASFGPAGDSLQLGVGGSDLLGRLSWLALAGLGDGAGPRGATLAAAWRGWRWAPSLALFSSLERPSAQRFEGASGFDRERRGGELAFTFESRTSTPLQFQPFLAFERMEALATHEVRNRTLAGVNLRVAHLWMKGEHLAFALEAHASAAAGHTGRQSWNLQRGDLSFRFTNKVLPVTLRGDLAQVGGGPSSWDRLHLGGAPTSLVPPTLELNRLDQAALPGYTAVGDRAWRWRGELGAGLRAYLEHTQLWTHGEPRPAATRVAGIEAALHELLPLGRLAPLLGSIEFTVGVHRPLDGPMKDRTVGTLGLIVRP